ncbi:catechol 2,3-dioxygenase-like lactoylglutathione lyase family enzyme [Actinokineospora baliensis]|uniref:VOC family protein n=1 Tax=Actinokineospora baliensis TaxID=547056 RepID=UPI00195EC516|nr:VOC family protein [Actinokineospora baliensis]MBM7775463.1 catechol 2,3-dioxygenase-like lactoylglutathione lyase family enzyme [Actinokineospora baliensis]
MRLGMVTLVVRDYDEAVAFYAGVLGFRLEQDTDLGGRKRWVVLDAGPVRLLLAEAAAPEQAKAIGAQAGGRVGWFLESEDFAADHARLVAAGVEFEEEPRQEAYGTVAVFRDLYGNRWDLLQSRRPRTGAGAGPSEDFS